MSLSIEQYFLIAFVATFLGALPFGAINLSVVSITISKNFKKGFNFSFAASLIEILEASIAILFGTVIQMFLNENNWIQFLVFSVFIALGLYNLFRKTNPKLKDGSKMRASEFIKGLLVSIGNPQAIPFWIFVLAYLAQRFDLNFMGEELVWFLAGVFLGKLIALTVFGLLSTYLKTRLKTSCNLINKFMGTVLLLIGLFQAFKFFF